MKELERIFKGLVSEETLKNIVGNYEKYADVNIKELGVDSLAIMELVFRIEDIYNIEFDYEKFDIADIGTPQKVVSLIHKEEIYNEIL